MEGFLFAQYTGTYTFSTDSNVDNYLGLWSYDNAYAYTNDNADFQGVRAGSSGYHGGSFSYSLTAGDIVPLTFIYMNGGGIGSYTLTYTNPQGTASVDGAFIPACEDGNPWANA